ncbi:hypothetical protein GH5_00455 [Leishmania sp. Ghana 2012 LV757]|uniref:hypothetical protein n=1 Tax=Leishmania sp. Ghana 2012 LV757 TaxID=2803181 RepID=UPI001B72350F|nr:hypothetical protein GH5_00455 [Leishmania sp. Ghana 2012 LV757]
MGKPGRPAEKGTFAERVVDALCSVFSLRIALSSIYLSLVVLLCTLQGMSLFYSPLIHMMNIQSSRIVGAKTFLSEKWFKVEETIYGANATLEVDIMLWAIKVDINVEIPYGFSPQNISQLYRVQDVPCAEFRSTLTKMQIFSILSIFTGCFVWVFTVSNFFTRMFLPLLWLFLWTTIAFTATTVAMMFRILCEGACYGEADEIPPLITVAMPVGGFALAFICFQTYLITSLMTVFL